MPLEPVSERRRFHLCPVLPASALMFATEFHRALSEWNRAHGTQRRYEEIDQSGRHEILDMALALKQGAQR